MKLKKIGSISSLSLLNSFNHFCFFRFTIPSPVIDGINDKTFEYEKGSSNLIGGFDSDFVFDWLPRKLNKRIKDNSLPFE